MHFIGKEPFPVIYVDGKEEGVKYEPAAKSQMKKVHKIWDRDVRKAAEKSKKEEEDAGKRTKNLEEAKKIVIEEDKSLPAAERIKIVDCELMINIIHHQQLNDVYLYLQAKTKEIKE